MNIFKRIIYRAYQITFRSLIPLLPYREPIILKSTCDVGKILKDNAVESVLIVTRRAPTNLIESLDENNIKYVIYNNTKPNPTVENVEEGVSLYTKNQCKAIIAIGGGSPIDCAKAIGARIAYPNKSVSKLKGMLKVLRKIPLLIAIPTTAGTGSEVTLAAVISEPQKNDKYALMSFPLIPSYAILDAKLTYSLPPHLTATTGVDALTHAVEAYIGRSTTRKTRALAITSVQRIFKYLERAYNNGDDGEARENMLIASYEAGIAFSISYVGYVHAIAHSLGGRYDIPHGLANAVIMPHVLEAYGKSAHKKLHKLAVAIGVSGKDDSHIDGAQAFIQAVKNLNTKMNIQSGFSEINESDISTLAKHAAYEANPLYPVPKLMSNIELEEIYRKIMR